MTRGAAWAAVVATLTAWGTARAQVPQCGGDLTLAECIARVEGRNVEQRVTARSTGIGINRAGTSISDFLPLLTTMLNGPADNAAEALAVDYTLRFDFDPTKPGGQPFRMRATRYAPEPYAPLIQALPESLRIERAAAIESGLGQFADLELQVAWTLESNRFGRNAEHHGALVGQVVDELINGVAGATSTSVTAVSRYMNEIPDDAFEPGCDPDAAGDARTLKLSCLKPDARARLVSLVVTAVEGDAALYRAVQAAFGSKGLFRLGDLINNQPQLSIETHGRLRDSLVGPDTWGASLRFELGFANANGLRSYCRRRGTTPAACLAEYLDLPGVVAALGRGDRVWLSVDYAGSASYAVALPADSVSLTLPRSHAVTVAGGVGRYVGQTGGGLEAGRLDLRAGYVFRIDDAVRENRLVASVTYTQRLTDGAALVVGLDYANKPEYLGEVDSKLGANVGVRYALHRSGGGG